MSAHHMHVKSRAEENAADCVVRCNSQVTLGQLRRAVDAVIAEEVEGSTPAFSLRMFCFAALVSGEFRHEEVASMTGLSLMGVFDQLAESRRSGGAPLAQAICRKAWELARKSVEVEAAPVAARVDKESGRQATTAAPQRSAGTRGMVLALGTIRQEGGFTPRPLLGGRPS